jgi:hypothetical protein
MTERPAMLKRATDHYAKRLRNLKEDKEDERIIAGNDFLKQDLEINANQVGKAIANFESDMEYRKILCYALSCYITDLEESKKAVGRKLPNAKLTFENIDREITTASVAKEQICKAYGINTESAPEGRD